MLEYMFFFLRIGLSIFISKIKMESEQKNLVKNYMILLIGIELVELFLIFIGLTNSTLVGIGSLLEFIIFHIYDNNFRLYLGILSLALLFLEIDSAFYSLVLFDILNTKNLVETLISQPIKLSTSLIGIVTSINLWYKYSEPYFIMSHLTSLIRKILLL